MNNYDKIKQAVSDAQALEPIPAIKHILKQTGLGLGAAKMVYNMAVRGESQIGRDYNFPYVREVREVLEYILRDIKTEETTAESTVQVERDVRHHLDRPTMDPELQAIQAILDALSRLPTPQRQRVLAYVSSRVT